MRPSSPFRPQPVGLHPDTLRLRTARLAWLLTPAFLLLWLLFSTPSLRASCLPTPVVTVDSGRVLILSDRVGPVLSAEELAHFHIFTRVARLQEAVAVSLPDSSLAFILSIRGSDGLEQDSLVPCSSQLVLMIAEKIDHYEALEEGTYQMGTDTPALRFAGYNLPVPPTNVHYTKGMLRPEYSVSGNQYRPSENRYSGSVPQRPATIGSPLKKQYPHQKLYPAFNFSVAMRSFSPDRKGLANTLGPGIEFGALITGGVELLISELFGFQVEGGGSTENNAWALTWGPMLYLPLFSDPNIRPFAGGGYAAVSAEGSGNGFLMEAGAKGFYLSAGLEYILGTGAAINLFGTYSSFKKVSTTFQDYQTVSDSNGTYTTTSQTLTSSMNFSHSAVGIRFKILL